MISGAKGLGWCCRNRFNTRDVFDGIANRFWVCFADLVNGLKNDLRSVVPLRRHDRPTVVFTVFFLHPFVKTFSARRTDIKCLAHHSAFDGFFADDFKYLL